MIGVIGLGVMGLDVTITLVKYGHELIVFDKNPEVMNNFKAKIKQQIRSYKMMVTEFCDVNTNNILERITLANSIEDFNKADFIIENIIENKNEKIPLYKKLNEVCKSETIFAVNTSCISITEIASAVSNAGNVIGMHFMNPVPMKKIAEVVKGYHTSDNTIKEAEELLKSINKKAIIVNDYPGFVANRLSHLFMNEAAFLIQDSVTDAESVDAIFKYGYGHSMGPLETADLIGLDTVVNSLDILWESYQDPKFRCCPLLKKMVAAGLLGKKSGQGFYKY